MAFNMNSKKDKQTITPDDGYKRDASPLRNYAQLSAFYISKTKQVDYKKAYNWVVNKLKNTTFPNIKHLERQANGDRVIKLTPLDQYYARVNSENRLLSGTGTVYKQPTEELSLFTVYINEGRANRSVFKNRMHAAKQAKDTETANFNNELQNDEKISNNTLSGATTTSSCITHMASAHPSLASTGRLATSFANAINEKLLRGNRHFYTPALALDTVTVLAYKVNRVNIQNAIDAYNLHIPTADEVMDMITASTKNYWRNSTETAKIKAFVETLDPLERCNVLYEGSLWDLSKHNPELIYKFIDELSEPADYILEKEEAEHYVNTAFSDLKTLAFYLCFEIATGSSLHDGYDAIPEVYGKTAATIKELVATFDKYEPLITAFLKLETLPGNVFDIKSMYRKAVVTSDTDSTNFTCQELCKFVTGKYGLTPKDRKITFLMTFMSSMLVMQALGIMSANMGVQPEYIRELSMKNEYYIPIHCLTPAAKNYIMVQGGQEGNILPVLELITKGVELRSSKTPKLSLDQFERYKQDILLSLEAGKDLYTEDILTRPTTLEYIIDASLNLGEVTWLITEVIKKPEAYAKREQESKVKNHNFYEAVFGDKYGHVIDIPYDGYQVDCTLRNKTMVKKWVDSIKDLAVRKRAIDYIEKNKITKITRFSIPKPIFAGKHIPEEIMLATDIDNLTSKAMAPWYALLESFGIYLRNKHHSKMLIKTYAQFIDLDVFDRAGNNPAQKVISKFIELNEDIEDEVA